MAGLTCEPYSLFHIDTGSIALSTSCQYNVCCVLPGPHGPHLLTQLKIEFFLLKVALGRKQSHCCQAVVLDFTLATIEVALHTNRVVYFTQNIIISFDPYNTCEKDVFECHAIQPTLQDAPSPCFMDYVGAPERKLSLVWNYAWYVAQESQYTA